MHSLVTVIGFATLAIPALTEAGIAWQAWCLPDTESRKVAATHGTVLVGLVGIAVGLTALIVSQAADAAGYSQRNRTAPTAYNTQANPNYGFGPRVRVQPTDVISAGRVVGRDPDPFIRGEILRHYNNWWPG
jgi:hypothetical protein